MLRSIPAMQSYLRLVLFAHFVQVVVWSMPTAIRPTSLTIVCRASAENCIVAAEGQLQHNGRFKVTALGMPPNERREESVVAAKV